MRITDRAADKDAQQLDEHWANLLSAVDAHFIMAVSCAAGLRHISDEECARVGLLKEHCYSLLDAAEVVAYGTRVRLVKIYNPWSTHTWNGVCASRFQQHCAGDWGNHTRASWPADVLRRLLEGAHDGRLQAGESWMPFEVSRSANAHAGAYSRSHNSSIRPTFVVRTPTHGWKRAPRDAFIHTASERPFFKYNSHVCKNWTLRCIKCVRVGVARPPTFHN
jgi:hypothetical protein